MKVHREQDDVAHLKGNVVTIGTFDGVHRAHQSIINAIVDLAHAKKCESILITFEPHPRSVVYPKNDELRLLTSLEEKLALLQQTALDHVVVFPFTAEFSQQQPEEYVHNFLLGKFNPKGIIIGFDHRFGINRSGNFELLKNQTAENDITLVEISKKVSNEIKISSSAIRRALIAGNIRDANRLLGYRYLITGTVIKGESIGTTLGYPTANLNVQHPKKLIPKPGIYAAFVHVRGDRYDGLLYIGHKPSIQSGPDLFIEVNLRNFKGYLYGEHLQIELVDFIRDDEKFTTLDDLRLKIQEDEQQIISILEAEKDSNS